MIVYPTIYSQNVRIKVTIYCEPSRFTFCEMRPMPRKQDTPALEGKKSHYPIFTPFWRVTSDLRRPFGGSRVICGAHLRFFDTMGHAGMLILKTSHALVACKSMAASHVTFCTKVRFFKSSVWTERESKHVFHHVL